MEAATVRQGALPVADAAHPTGVIGPREQGAGLAAEPGVVRTLTLSESPGSRGGAVLATPEVVQALIGTGRSFVFDTGQLPAALRRPSPLWISFTTNPDCPDPYGPERENRPRRPANSAWRPTIQRVRSSPSCSARPRPRVGPPSPARNARCVPDGSGRPRCRSAALARG
ncbi:aminotransferase class I/II-fold pyridoxal phosphate-dependent enzyme [Streptosporangium lutulentum]